MDRGAWHTTVHGVVKESEMTEWLKNNNNLWPACPVERELVTDSLRTQKAFIPRVRNTDFHLKHVQLNLLATPACQAEGWRDDAFQCAFISIALEWGLLQGTSAPKPQMFRDIPFWEGLHGALFPFGVSLYAWQLRGLADEEARGGP